MDSFSFAANFLLLVCPGPSLNQHQTMSPCSSLGPILHRSLPGSLRALPNLYSFIFTDPASKPDPSALILGKFHSQFAYELDYWSPSGSDTPESQGVPLQRPQAPCQPCSHIPDPAAQTWLKMQKYFVARCLPNVSPELGHCQVKQWVGHTLFISPLLCIIYRY